MESKYQRVERHSHSSGPPRGGRIGWIALLVVLGLGVLFVFGYQRRHRIETVAASAARHQQEDLPVVNVTKVRRAPAASELLLPGNITPVTQALIYARASGYVRRRLVDIGDHVKQGQLLAEIESPELDQQVQQARAALAQAEQQAQQSKHELENSRSQLELARVTWDRYKVLAAHGAISRQEADQQQATFRSATAGVSAAESNVSAAGQNVHANQANVERLMAMQGFENVRAPFTGIVTARNFDVGALISGNGGGPTAPAASNGGTQNNGAGGGEMFRIAQIGTLRIMVNVPQENAPAVRVGQPAAVLVSEFSKRRFQGKVTRTANSLDTSTRTMLTEVQLSNPDGVLLPGMYAQVQLTSSRANPPLLVSGDSLITGATGLSVAILADVLPGHSYPADAKRVHIQKIEVGRDYGQEIEVTSGLEGWEYVIVNPNDGVEDGAVVQPAAASQGPPPGVRPGAKH
jgi:multidrug efflux pump subunit AcrA (membrane-fusion protein)